MIPTSRKHADQLVITLATPAVSSIDGSIPISGRRSHRVVGDVLKEWRVIWFVRSDGVVVVGDDCVSSVTRTLRALMILS